MYLGHNGMPCPRRTTAGPSRTQSGFASGRGENLTDMGGLKKMKTLLGRMPVTMMIGKTIHLRWRVWTALASQNSQDSMPVWWWTGLESIHFRYIPVNVLVLHQKNYNIWTLASGRPLTRKLKHCSPFKCWMTSGWTIWNARPQP